jgi:hypothetical protein
MSGGLKLGGVAARSAGGWFQSQHFSKCILATFQQGNHPVRAFGASTPPDSGGDTRATTSSKQCQFDGERTARRW